MTETADKGTPPAVKRWRCLIFCMLMRKAVTVMNKTTFEKLGIPYEEKDGIFYPVRAARTEKANLDAEKYGHMWI